MIVIFQFWAVVDSCIVFVPEDWESWTMTSGARVEVEDILFICYMFRYDVQIYSHVDEGDYTLHHGCRLVAGVAPQHSRVLTASSVNICSLRP